MGHAFAGLRMASVVTDARSIVPVPMARFATEKEFVVTMVAVSARRLTLWGMLAIWSALAMALSFVVMDHATAKLANVSVRLVSWGMPAARKRPTCARFIARVVP